MRTGTVSPPSGAGCNFSESAEVSHLFPFVTLSWVVESEH